MVQGLDMSRGTRFPVEGGLLQPRGGTARHDAVAWGYAYGADRQGVDLIENCEVTGFIRENGALVGVATTRGTIRAGKVGVAVAGSTSVVLQKAGLRALPTERPVLQAFVSEALKPPNNTAATLGACHHTPTPTHNAVPVDG